MWQRQSVSEDAAPTGNAAGPHDLGSKPNRSDARADLQRDHGRPGQTLWELDGKTAAADVCRAPAQRLGRLRADPSAPHRKLDVKASVSAGTPSRPGSGLVGEPPFGFSVATVHS
jgi:hypothetical protein